MSYIDRNLLPQEKVVYRAYLHWIVYLPGVIFLIAAIAVWTFGSNTSGDRSAYAALGGLSFLVGLCILLFRWIERRTSEFGVTNKRVLIKVGLIRRNSIELLLRQIEGISVEQTILGRVLGYGSIVVGGTGGTKEPFAHISRPLEFRKQIQRQSIESSAAPSQRAEPSEEKTCPNCAERVKAAARACRFCGHRFG